jgi:uncharacterized peroxidase-related enzyme
MSFTLHTQSTAPDGSRKLLAVIEQQFGFVPNLFAVQAESPAMLEGFQALYQAFESTALSATERETVLLATSFENGCAFCVAAHTAAAFKRKVSPEVVASLREGRSIDDAKLEALHRFTRALVTKRGAVTEEETASFLRAGYDNRALLEVIMGVALMVMSNYTNRLAKTPLNASFEPFAWTDSRVDPK